MLQGATALGKVHSILATDYVTLAIGLMVVVCDSITVPGRKGTVAKRNPERYGANSCLTTLFKSPTPPETALTMELLLSFLKNV